MWLNVGMIDKKKAKFAALQDRVKCLEAKKSQLLTGYLCIQFCVD